MDEQNTLSVTIRPAYPDDLPALWRLAALDSAALPLQPLLVAEVDGQLKVAVSMADRRAIADPFTPTAGIVEILRNHIARTTDSSHARRRRRSNRAVVAGLLRSA